MWEIGSEGVLMQLSRVCAQCSLEAEPEGELVEVPETLSFL